MPFFGTEGKTVRYQWTSLPLSAVKRQDYTINDCVLAAYLFTLASTCPDVEALTVHMTVDLRRYLDETSRPVAANLSGMASVSLPNVPDASYAALLANVHRQTSQLKEKPIGLSSAAMMTYLRTLPYAQAKAALAKAADKSRAMGSAAPLLSNLGRIASNPLTFGQATVKNVLALLPAMHAPSFMLGASGYGDTLTLSAGYYAEERKADDVKTFLNCLSEVMQEGMRAGCKLVKR